MLAIHWVIGHHLDSSDGSLSIDSGKVRRSRSDRGLDCRVSVGENVWQRRRGLCLLSRIGGRRSDGAQVFVGGAGRSARGYRATVEAERLLV